MSLVPIIYTSLILFFGLMVLILFFSYLSFRARAKANPLIEEVKKSQKSIYSAPKPIVNRETQIIYKYEPRNTAPVKTNKELIYIEEKLNQQPIIVRANYFQQSESYHRKPIPTKTVFEDNSIRTRYNNITGVNKTRIEIMNDSEKYNTKKRTEIFEDRPIRNIPNRDVNHLNIFTFYSDNIESDLNSITAVPIAKSV